MRNEFYGDRKDLWKWTVALDEARERQILYLAMYRPDRKIKPMPGVRADVIKFFHAEHVALSAEKQCSRIRNLSSRIVPFLAPYEPREMNTFLAPVKQALESRIKTSSYVVFLDPDTGIREESGPEHACPRLLASVWKSMLAGDTLLIYQHYPRKKLDSWLPAAKELIATALQADFSDVNDKRHSGVCFFSVCKRTNHAIDSELAHVQTEHL
jgi:hypothetical protein